MSAFDPKRTSLGISALCARPTNPRQASGKDKVIKHKDTRNINVYVHDDIGSDEAKPRIVAEYIGDKEALWKAYGEGLLQVYDIDKTIVTPPHISSDDE
jgi:hypothetical protein